MNIELIISFMRLLMIINKSLKIMILSATIDEDEDNYISFFNEYKKIRVNLTFSRLQLTNLLRTEHYLSTPL
jgi:hypothetical protein